MPEMRSHADRILIARLSGTAKRHANRRVAGHGWDAAVAELRELAGGRGDLLAEVAGIAEGAHRGEPGEWAAMTVAALAATPGRTRP
jgi:hypothetical protein